MGFGILFALSFAAVLILGGESATFTITNKCPNTIWPATLTSSGPQPSTSGFELPSKASNTINAPAPWSGRIWARTFCTTGGSFTCRTGDCGRGLECNGAGGAPPGTLVEFALNGDGGKDFYDVSLVDGFNLPVRVAPQAACETTSCPVDINKECPGDLTVKDQNGATIGCKSACAAFNKPEDCCTGEFNSPDKCKPSSYSTIVKGKCPQAYSSAYDDPSNTVTCPTGANYTITFCPQASHVIACVIKRVVYE